MTTSPHLPFEDRYFDLIYCGSIFTHIDDLADAWLLELRRILRPGGRLYITVADKHYWDQVQKIDDWPPAKWMQELEKKKKISKLDFAMFTSGRSHRSMVLYDIEYLQRHWGCFLNVLSISKMLTIYKPRSYWRGKSQSPPCSVLLGRRRGWRL